MKIVVGILVAVIIGLVAGWALGAIPSLPRGSEDGYEVTFNAFLTQNWQYYLSPRYEPAGLVQIKNTDEIQRTFKVEIIHYIGDKGFTKEFTLQIEPGQVKSALVTKSDLYNLPGQSAEDSELVRAVREAGRNGHDSLWRNIIEAGNWGIDYSVTPLP